MSQPNLAAMRAVADRLDSLGLGYAFLGGSIVNLLVDNPALSPARPTAWQRAQLAVNNASPRASGVVLSCVKAGGAVLVTAKAMSSRQPIAPRMGPVVRIR